MGVIVPLYTLKYFLFRNMAQVCGVYKYNENNILQMLS